MLARHERKLVDVIRHATAFGSVVFERLRQWHGHFALSDRWNDLDLAGVFVLLPGGGGALER